MAGVLNVFWESLLPWASNVFADKLSVCTLLLFRVFCCQILAQLGHISISENKAGGVTGVDREQIKSCNLASELSQLYLPYDSNGGFNLGKLGQTTGLAEWASVDYRATMSSAESISQHSF